MAKDIDRGSGRPRARTAHERKVRSARKRRQQKFLRKLREWGTVYEACRRVADGLSTATVYKWCQSDADFRRRLLEAKECSVQRLETSAYRRAIKGDTLLTIFMLKAYRPDVYRDRYEGKIDEAELNSAIERELDRVAASRPTAIPGVVEGEVRSVEVQSSPETAGVPKSDV